MAGNIYLYLDGIPGESYADGYVNWIDVDSFSLGVTMEIDQDARTGSGGGTSGGADPDDLQCSTKMSAATPVLLQCCALGAIIPRAKLVQCNVVNAGNSSGNIGPRVVVSEYAFGDSIISNVALDGSGGGIPDQSLSLNYGSIIWKYLYYKHDNPSVPSGAPIMRGWSLLRKNPEEADPNAQEAMFNLTANETGYTELFPTFTGSLTFSKQEPVDATKPSLQNWEEKYL